MKLCNRDILKIHDVHPVWSSLPAVTREVKKAQIKARLLTGTYRLQSDMQRFSKEKDEQKCELCQIEQENMEHFLLRCPADSLLVHFSAMFKLIPRFHASLVGNASTST
jgi:hypothetical protein